MGNLTPASMISQFLAIRTINAKVPKATLRKISLYFANPADEYRMSHSYEFTNDPEYKIEPKEPYADPQNVASFKELQMFESVGLVEPVGTEHMYFAAMESKSCKLTALGPHYWKLSKDRIF